MTNKPATVQEIGEVMKAAQEAFEGYRKTTPAERANLLEAISKEIDALGDTLILKASEETRLPVPRLTGERARTTLQLRAFAGMLREGSWVDASIDTAVPDRTPLPKPDIRKMVVPLGPVIVFGASNFPFAYSTAGGDTASALAAGCPVVVKAHPAHAETSQMVYEAISKAVGSAMLPQAVFQHVYGDNETGRALLQHPATAGAGFTGSYGGGMALVNYARDRKDPIPVFCEMGSVNPVVIFPDALRVNAGKLVEQYAESITQSAGQFCTNPGVLLAVKGPDLDRFVQALSREVGTVQPARMLHAGIHRAYREKMEQALQQPGVVHEEGSMPAGAEEALPRIASVDAATFLENRLLQQEVFGPYSIVVRCNDMTQLYTTWTALKGQITTSLMGTEKDFADYAGMIHDAAGVAGRIIFNGVPTGVEVCASMVHGGPFPATTDSRFTAVGIQSVRRWVRPVCYQNCPDTLLPQALQNANPLHILRFVNNAWTREAVGM